MKKAFKLTARIKDTDKVFAEGWAPGEFASKELHFDIDPEEYERPSFIHYLIQKQDEMMKEHMEIVLEEVPVDSGT